MRHRLAAAAAVAALAALFVAVPAPALAADPIWDPIANAQRLQGYRISNLPPTMEDLVRYNPGKSVDELTDMYIGGQEKWLYQRQDAVTARGLNGAADAQTIADYKAAQERSKSKYRLPVTKPGTLAKTATGGAIALTGLPIAFTATTAGLKAVGVNVDGLVCENGGLSQIYELAQATDCAGMFALADEYIANQDARAGTVGEKVCEKSTPARCVTLTGSGVYTSTSGVVRNLTGWSATSGKTTVYVAQKSTPTQAPTQTLSRADSTQPATQPAGAAARLFGADSYWIQTIDPANIHRYYADPITTAGVASSGVTQGTADPERTIACTVTGTDGLTYTSTTAPYRESAGEIAPPACPALPEGVFPTNLALSENGPKGSTPLAPTPVDPQYADFVQKYPECATGLCTLELLTLPDLSSCFDQGDTCDGWFSDPERDRKYTCTYSGKAVEITRCSLYRQTFNPDMRANGAPYSDPLTGRMSDKPTTPTLAGTLMGSKADPVQCVANSMRENGAWAFVFAPVQCVFIWAAIPNPAALATLLGNTLDTYMATPMGQIVSTVATWNLSMNLTGCNGFPLTIDSKWLQWSGRIGDACPGTALADWPQWSRLFLNALVIISGGLGVVNITAGLLNMRGIGRASE